MLTTLSIVSPEQGKQLARGEDDYYQRTAGWQTPQALGRFLGWLTRARGDVPTPATPHAAISLTRS